MSLANLAGLKAAALAWMEHTGELAATTIIDDCVALCEQRINLTPNLRVREMETEGSAITLTSGSGTLPADFLGMKTVVSNVSPAWELTYTPVGTYSAEIAAYNGTDDSYPFYTIVGSTVRSLGSSTLTPIYYAKVPSLTVTNPNWLLTKAPGVYLYGTLLEMATALEGDTERWGSLFQGAIEQLIGANTFYAGPMTMRASGPTP